MNKPIGYYTDYTPGDGGLLEDMQEEWGPQFQKLNDSERLWLIARLAEDVLAEQSDAEDISESVEIADERKSELSRRDRLGLIEALVNQVKNSK